MQYQHEPYDAGKHSAHPTRVFMALRLLRQHEIVEASEEEIPELLYERFERNKEEVERVVEKVLDSNEDIFATAIASPSLAAR